MQARAELLAGKRKGVATLAWLPSAATGARASQLVPNEETLRDWLIFLVNSNCED